MSDGAFVGLPGALRYLDLGTLVGCTEEDAGARVEAAGGQLRCYDDDHPWLTAVTDADLGAIAAARAGAREVAWAQRGEQTGTVLPASLVAGQALLAADGRPVLVIDEDATVVIAHSEKEQAAATFKNTWGFRPVLAFCDNTNEALTGMLRRGNAGSNTAIDHIEVIDAALAQIPPEYRHGYPVLFRFDGAGASKALLAHLRGLREQGVDSEFSVGWAVTVREHAAITALPDSAWAAAVDGDPREGAAVVELTGMFAAGALRDYPEGMRVIARRERPHPGAQLDLIEEADGWRYTCLATDTQHGQYAWLDARHRCHARVEDRIRCGKDTGLARFPSKLFAVNQVWLACALTAIDLLAWTQTILLHDHPISPEPNPRRCATGCCTPRPGSCTAGDESASGSTGPGAGPTHSPPRSTDSTRCPHPRPEPPPPTLRPATDNPATNPGDQPRPN